MADVTLLIAVGFSMFGFVSTETYPCGTGTIYPERGTQVVVDCGVTTDHIAVFWYRDSTGSDPFLRLEGGRKTESAGFTIQDNGAMVITSADVTHDGLYVNRVIGNDGQSRDTNITVEVKVSLASEPVIVDCSLSMHDVCTSVEEGKRQTTLACIAGPAKPPVPISWSSFDGTKQQSEYSSTQNGSTSLYTSTSLLEYNSADYLLEYFTCSVSGEAVTETVTTGMFMKGNKDTVVQQQETNYVKSGADVSLECPLASGGTLGEWGIEFPNNTYRWLWRKYPGFDGGPCVDADDCDVQANGNLHLSKVTYINEGHYLCTYASDVLKFPVEVLVSPEPQKTVIKGCEVKDDCELNVANSGSLECSIFGSRPSINPKVTVDKEFNPHDSSEVFIFGEELVSVEGSRPGTFDTVVRFEYTIPECSDVIRIECFAGDDTHSDNIMKTVVNLVTATSGCDQGGGRPGLIVFLVLFFILLFGIVGIFLYVKRYYIMAKLGILTGDENKDAEQALELIPDNTPQEVKNTEIPEDETKRLQKIFDEKFQIIYLAIIDKKAKYENFHAMMHSFSRENKVNVPVPYLASFLKNEGKPGEDVLKVLEFVIDNFNNQWIGYFLKMLDDLLETNQLTATNYITLIGSLVRKRVIELSRYVELTGAFLNNKTASFDIILADLKNMIDRGYCSREDLSNTFLRYYVANYITDDAVLKELSETEMFQFLPPYFLQSVYREFQVANETKMMGKLSLIFKKVFDQLMSESLELSFKLEPYIKLTGKQTAASSEEEQTNTTEKQNPVDETEKSNETEDSPLLNSTEPDKQADSCDEVEEKAQESNKGADDADEVEGNAQKEENQELVTNGNDETEIPNELESHPLIDPSETDRRQIVTHIEKDEVKKEMRSALIKALLFAMDGEQIKIDECVKMIKDTKLSQAETGESLSSYIDNLQAEANNSWNLLEQTLTQKMISEETYLKLIWVFVTHRKEVNFDKFMDHFKTLLQNKLVTEKCFEQTVSNFIEGRGIEQAQDDKKVKKENKKDRKKHKSEMDPYTNYWNWEEWITFVTGLAMDRKRDVKNQNDTNKTDVKSDAVIGNSLRLTLFQCIVSTNKLKKSEVEDVMKKRLSIHEKGRKRLLKSVKFAGVLRR